ncbi:MAG: DUF3822 family protein [Bacteroidales bacterium]|nr:DUF3822 family protein [Bacteroidales bacterium]MDD4602201.1 DUF3822 family protein [Bacteroidales bacterium]
MADFFNILVNKLDESLNLQETRQYGLSILLSEVMISYCILDFKRNKFLGIQQIQRSDHSSRNIVPAVKPSLNDFINAVIKAQPWLKNQFKSIQIAYVGEKVTLIPSQLFDPNEKGNYLQFNFVKEQEEQVFSDHLIPFDTQLVYTVPSVLIQSMNVHFPNIKIVHFAGILMNSIWINYKNRINTHRVFLHVRETHFDLLIYDGRQMNYFNSFPFQSAEDVAYYLIFVLEQLNFNPETMPLVLLGNVEKGSAMFELLFKYVRHIEFGHRNESFKYSHILNQISPHAFYPLFNFQSCGL